MFIHTSSPVSVPMTPSFAYQMRDVVCSCVGASRVKSFEVWSYVSVLIVLKCAATICPLGKKFIA